MLASKLKYGDTIGVIGISNSMEQNPIPIERVMNAKKMFENKGFRVKLAETVFKDYYGSAGTKEERAKAIMEMFEDDEIKAIICLVGGQTCNNFLDLLDYETIKNNPKIFVGYSDATVLLQTLNEKTGLITFSGAAFDELGSDRQEEYYAEFEKVFVKGEIGKFSSGEKKVIREGNCRAILTGTNLGSMMYQMGTPYFPNVKGKILAIESMTTSPNECSRRFAQLKYAGVFDKIAGVIIGYNYDLQKNGDIFPQMEDILLEYTKEYDFPIIKCNEFGHEIVMATLPIGAEYEIKDGTVKIVSEFLK